MNIKIKNLQLGTLIVVASLLLTICLPIKVTASTSSLRITELMYDPTGDGTREFLEIYNGSDVTVNLGGMYMFGVIFTFPAGSTLSPGQYGVIVRNQAKFSPGGAKVFGQYGGKLDGSGETISLLKSGTTLSTVTYAYGGAWPSNTKDIGPSLSLIRPTANERQPGCWAPSASDGGTPGRSNTINTSWNGGACGSVGYPVTQTQSTPSPTSGTGARNNSSSSQSSAATQQQAAEQAEAEQKQKEKEKLELQAKTEAKVAEEVSKEVAQASAKKAQDDRTKKILAVVSLVVLAVATGSVVGYINLKRRLKFKKLIAQANNKSKVKLHGTKKTKKN
jgi:hypothetical protein